MAKYFAMYIRLLLCLFTFQNLAEVQARGKQEYEPSVSWPGKISMPANSMLVPMYNARASTIEPMRRMNPQGPPNNQLAFDKPSLMQAQYNSNYNPEQEGRIAYEQPQMQQQPPPSPYQQPQMQQQPPPSPYQQPQMQQQTLAPFRGPLQMRGSALSWPQQPALNGQQRLSYDLGNLNPVPRDSLPAAQPPAPRWDPALGRQAESSLYANYASRNPQDSDSKRVFAGQMWVEPKPRSAV